MNQKCKVCGEPAAGFHFGAFTCEGCKSFFGRTYSNVTAIGECKNGGQCVINKKNRTSCKACRLRKCLFVGMSKSGSRYGRRSNWFKIHCLLQEQTGMDQPLQGMFNGNPSNSSPEVKEEEEEEQRTPSTSSRSQSPMDDEENHSTTSKENLRLMLSPAAESPCSFKHRPTAVFKRTSPQPGLLAIGSPYATVIHHPVRTSSPKPPSESGSSGRHHHQHQSQHASATAAALYQLYHQQQQLLQQTHRHHSVSPTDHHHHRRRHPVDDDEQESPIDLSCKSSSSSPTGLNHSSSASMCHIRAEILTGLHPQSLRDAESSGAPLDLTTKG